MKKIIVVGAGVAGLSAALRLRELGADVRVLEKDSQPGGRVQSVRENGFIVDRGASILMTCYHQTFELIRKLGLGSDLERPRVPSHYTMLCNGRFLEVDYGSRFGFMRCRAIPLAQRLRAGRMAAPALRLSGPRSFNFMTTQGLDALDDESLGHFISRVVGNDATEYFFEPLLSAWGGWVPEDLSRSYQAFITRIGKLNLFVFRKGIGQLTEALARTIPVECSVKALSVAEAEGAISVAVEGANHTQQILKADGVVIALPGPEVTNLWTGCSEPERRFLGQVSYVPGVLVHLCTDKDWGYKGNQGFLYPRKSGRMTTGVALEHIRFNGRAPEGKSLLYTGLRLDKNSNLFSASDDEVTDMCMHDIEPEFPGIRSAVQNNYVFRWNNTLPQIPVGFFKKFRKFLDTRTSSRIELAGDYIGGPCIEGAVASGNAAAQRLYQTITGWNTD